MRSLLLLLLGLGLLLLVVLLLLLRLACCQVCSQQRCQSKMASCLCFLQW
jgi:hypothetical protein